MNLAYATIFIILALVSLFLLVWIAFTQTKRSGSRNLIYFISCIIAAIIFSSLMFHFLRDIEVVSEKPIKSPTYVIEEVDEGMLRVSSVSINSDEAFEQGLREIHGKYKIVGGFSVVRGGYTTRIIVLVEPKKQ